MVTAKVVKFQTAIDSQFGYKEPERPQQQPGTPPIDGRKFMEDWTTKFIKDNADQIRLTRYVQK